MHEQDFRSHVLSRPVSLSVGQYTYGGRQLVADQTTKR